MENSFNVLEKQGIMLVFDYCTGDDGNIGRTIKDFLEKYDGQYEDLNKGNQLAIRKQ